MSDLGKDGWKSIWILIFLYSSEKCRGEEEYYINSKNMFMNYFGSKAVCDLQCNYGLKLEIHAMEWKYKFGLKN